jgi:GTP-binding protein EngB required for normal cell division
VPYIDIGSVVKALGSLSGDDDSNNSTIIVEKKPKRLAEILKSNHYAKQIKQGHPNVYQLNAKEVLSSDDFRWFNIGRVDAVVSPSDDHRDHKVIILMGSTGSGKSTLIDAMVNYILGVKWKDSFRFKCVRDDNSSAVNASQTTSVTAYTIHHQEGMTVPYSITIIDTPGYGGSKGAKRDKEITRNIQQFLTQNKNRIDQIHAACFVAASGDSRLTATQRYAIDSVYSVFGKDVKENMRLLVTFADNSQPPVVDACLAANFPVTFPSAGISYSKFNNSVIYANNEQHGDEEDELSFDERFWKMSQENFYKFFTMLGGMNGRGRKSAPEVFQSRQLLEHSLDDMKRELADCLVNIENMEMFRRQMRDYGHKMDQFNDQVQISLMRSRAAEEQAP